MKFKLYKPFVQITKITNLNTNLFVAFLQVHSKIG